MRHALVLSTLLLAACSSQLADVNVPADDTPSPNQNPVGSFPLGGKGWSATLLSLNGPDTKAASMTGRVMDGDAKEYCERDPGGMTVAYGGSLTVDQCVRQIVQSEGATLFTASADCIEKTMTSTHGRYVFVGVDHQFFEPQWRSESNNEVLDGSGASGAAVLTAQFALLCPTVARAWRPRS